MVGQRVRVWWEGDNAWFHGKVDNFSSRRGHRIMYDPVEGQDDPSGWVQLDEETWELEGARDDTVAPTVPPLPVSASTAVTSGDGEASKALGKRKRAPEPSADATETAAGASPAAQEAVKSEVLTDDAESRASGLDDASDLVEMTESEAAAMRQAQAQEEAHLLRRHQEAAALQERRQRSARTQIFDKKPIRTPDTFECPRCNWHNYYPKDARACNKLACEKCHTKFCIVCGKAASASCRCISAAWARGF